MPDFSLHRCCGIISMYCAYYTQMLIWETYFKETRMKIWLINNYNMLPEHGQNNRHYFLAKYLKKLGHEPTVFVGSHPHNTNLQLIEGKEKFKIYRTEPFPWVLIKTRNYEGSKKARVLSMLEFYRNMKKAAKTLDKPDVIIGSSVHPLAPLLAIVLGKKFNCTKIAEVRDLWPESIVAYGVAGRNNPVIRLLYKFEKYLYVHADSVIFTMENAYQYIEESGLTKAVPREKVFYVNNGVDLEEFNFNKNEYTIDDEDLNRSDIYKVVYTGSIRKVNNLGIVLDIAKLVKNPSVRFLIWGGGDQVEMLKKRVEDEKIDNVVFKGLVGKKYIPYVTSMADLNYMHNSPSEVLKYGLSANKLFDYAAAGKPILTDFKCGMNPAEVYKAGTALSGDSISDIAEEIDRFSNLNREEYEEYCRNAERLAKDYSYENLAKKMVEAINQTKRRVNN